MRHIHNFIIAATALLFSGCAHVTEPSESSLYSEKGELSIRYISPIGELTSQFNVSLRVQAIRFTSSDVQKTQNGAMVFVAGHSVFLPISQIAPLAQGIERVCATQPGIPPFESYRADYRVTCGISVSAPNSDSADMYSCWIDTGEKRFFTTREGLQQFKSFIIEAEKRVR